MHAPSFLLKDMKTPGITKKPYFGGKRKYYPWLAKSLVTRGLFLLLTSTPCKARLYLYTFTPGSQLDSGTGMEDNKQRIRGTISTHLKKVKLTWSAFSGRSISHEQGALIIA